MAITKKMDLLTSVEQIVVKAKGSGLSNEFYRKADKYIKYLSEVMDLTKEQSVMLALFIDNSDDSSISLSDISKFLGCSHTRIIKYLSETEVLERREFIRCNRGDTSVRYRVPMEVVEAFKNNEKYTPKNCSGLSCPEFFNEIKEVFWLRKTNELTYKTTVEKINHLFDCNSQLVYVQRVRSYKLKKEDEMLLVLFSNLFVNDNDDNIWFGDIDFLYEAYKWICVKRSLKCGNHILLREKKIDYKNNNGFATRDSFCITTETKRELFSELDIDTLIENEKRDDVIKTENITTKNLFYGDKISSQIDELNKLLDDAQYKEIRKRMKETGFRCGFTCLFYGAPGTGKTETVLQLAKRTGRDILQVNISQLKSKWVGDSEKNIKQIFDNYRTKIKECDIAPILLFNEADAIIGTRREGAESAVDKMENSIQNIILQEMETLDGILIATTNLAQNMDKAFERRFLYKIKFEKPTLEARINMWHEMIPVLKEEETRLLADKYDFSGGQIENIARHYSISNILHGEPENVIDALSVYCDNERLNAKETHKIGFEL